MATDNFIVNTNYPAEKIVWTAEGVCNSTNPYWINVLGGSVFEPLEDSLTIETLLIDGVWSNDNWTTQYPIGTNSRIQGYKQSSGGSYTAEFDNLTADVFMGGTQILSFTVPYNSIVVRSRSDSGNTIKYRLWAYVQESDWQSFGTSKTAETLAHSLQLNTNLAHLNLVSEQVVRVPSGQAVTLNHNLGYRPYCKMWRKAGETALGNTWMKNNLYTVFDPSNEYNLNKITIDSNKITIYAEDVYSGETQDFLIRIFNYALPI